MSGVTILEQQHVFVTLLDFRDGALLHGVIPNLNIFVYVLILSNSNRNYTGDRFCLVIVIETTLETIYVGWKGPRHINIY